MKNGPNRNLNGNSFLNIFSRLLLIITFLIIQLTASVQKKDNVLKIFMLWDMEGASGLFTKDPAWYYTEGVPKEIASEGREIP